MSPKIKVKEAGSAEFRSHRSHFIQNGPTDKPAPRLEKNPSGTSGTTTPLKYLGNYLMRKFWGKAVPSGPTLGFYKCFQSFTVGPLRTKWDRSGATAKFPYMGIYNRRISRYGA
jgi:hypothetical protein